MARSKERARETAKWRLLVGHWVRAAAMLVYKAWDQPRQVQRAETRFAIEEARFQVERQELLDRMMQVAGGKSDSR